MGQADRPSYPRTKLQEGGTLVSLALHAVCTPVAIRGEGVARKSTPKTTRKSDRKRSSRRPDSVKEAAPAYSTERDSLGKAIGAIFRSARETQGLSQDQVAALATGPFGAVSRTTVSSIERGRMPNVEALVSLSSALNVDPTEVLERVRLATQVPVDITGLSYDALRERALALFWAGDYRKALSIYDAMLEQLILDPPKDPDELLQRRVRIEVNRASALRRCGALAGSRVAAERAVSLATTIPELQTEAYVVLAVVLEQAGLLPFAQDAAEHAVAISDGLPSHAHAWFVKGEVLYASGAYAAARTTLVEARKLLRKAGDDKHLVHVEGSIGTCLLALGKRSQARKCFVEAVRLARKHGVPSIEASWLVELGRMALDDGDFDQADSLADGALRIAKPREQLLTVFRAEWLRHLIVQKTKPKSSDRHRLAFLRKLYNQVREHHGLKVIKEYEAAILNAPQGPPGRSS